MDFLEKNWKNLAFGLVILLVVGLGYSIYSTQSSEKEKKAQAAFANIEQQVLALKAAAAPGADKNADQKAAPVDKEKLKQDLEGFVSQFPGTVASQMASLALADIYSTESKNSEALAVLKKTANNSGVLSNTLVIKRMGQILSDMDQCAEAVQVWEKVVSNKQASFAHGDVKIQQALCYKKMNDLKKAEELLTSVKNNKTEGQEQLSQEADRILRLLKLNSTLGS